MTLGKETDEGGLYALKSLSAAVDALKKDIDALVTAPINKHNIQSDEFNFPGHTEYLANEFNGGGVNVYGCRFFKNRCGYGSYPIACGVFYYYRKDFEKS